MIEFLNPWLLGGLAVISAPVIIHLLHRRKVKQVDWGAMRFLLELMAKRRRRLFWDELLLLLIRSLIVACIALAMLRPALTRHLSATGSGAWMRHGRAAAVLLVDDSISSSAGRAQPAFESMKKLATTYVDSLAPGDEVSALQMSQLGTVANDPIFDLEAVKNSLTNLQPSAVATDIPRLLEAGLSQLKRHINPAAELVLITDGRKDGWHPEDQARWDLLRERLRGPPNAAPGTHQRPALFVLSPNLQNVQQNLAITRIASDRILVAAGEPATLRVSVAHFGPQGRRDANVQLAVNGQSIGSRRIEIPAGDQQEASFAYTFPNAGSYALEASLLDNQDSLPADDRRAFSLQVESGVPVLLVDGDSAQGLETKLGFLEFALQPERGQLGPYKVTRIPLAQLRPPLLHGFRVVVLGDARVLEPAMVDALERFVVAGGGILVGLGPDTDVNLVNRFWARSGEGFLPCPLGAPVSPSTPALPAVIDPAHPVFNGFGSKTDEAWKAAKVRSYFKLDTTLVKPTDFDLLLKLDNNDPLVVERRRGLGLVTLVTTTLNSDWTDLPLQAVYVPLMRGIVGHLGTFIIPPRNLEPGQPLIYPRESNSAKPLTAQDASGKPLNLASGAWEGRNALVSEPLLDAGVYSLNDPDQPAPVRFAVALAPAESTLALMEDRDLSRLVEKSPILHTPDQIAAQFDPARRQSVELWRWLLLAALGLLFLETLVTRREAGQNGRA